MNEKIRRYLAQVQPETPCLVLDLDVVAERYRRLRDALPLADIYYAVKANPAPQILHLLKGLGSSFDAASIYEIEMCLSAGIPARKLSFGSTIKKQRDIETAFEKGVRLFAFDSEAELGKLAAAAPGSQVFCRIFMDGAGAEWPLSRKFGCELDLAHDLMIEARTLGLDPYGVSFHVGSQQTDPGQWDVAVAKTAMLFTDLARAGIEVRMLNLGGGFPARYRTDVPDAGDYGQAIMASLARHFGNNLPALIAEPGRGLVGDAGVVQAEVVLISHKDREDPVRWVYLDVGKFGGLPETMDEAIKYRITTPHDGGATGRVVLAGPTCDEVDVLYEDAHYELPLALEIGDKIQVQAAGAYTTTYASIGFNGFPPLKEHYI